MLNLTELAWAEIDDTLNWGGCEALAGCRFVRTIARPFNPSGGTVELQVGLSQPPPPHDVSTHTRVKATDAGHADFFTPKDEKGRSTKAPPLTDSWRTDGGIEGQEALAETHGFSARAIVMLH